MLSELTHQVGTSSREVSQLQAKLEHANSARAEEQVQRAKIHQEQLKSRFSLSHTLPLPPRPPLSLSLSLALSLSLSLVVHSLPFSPSSLAPLSIYIYLPYMYIISHNCAFIFHSALEQRLLKQQADNSTERERLQTLVTRLESHIAQQSKTIEQDKWQLQQDTSRLKTQQSAFDSDRSAFLRKMAEDRDQLQEARERFLVEQREVLAKCYEERRSLASERAEVEVLKKKVQEREQRHKATTIQVCIVESTRTCTRRIRCMLCTYCMLFIFRVCVSCRTRFTCTVHVHACTL